MKVAGSEQIPKQIIKGRIKIIIFCAYFYPHEGGVEKYVKELCKDIEGVDVTIVTCNTEDARFHEKKFGFDIYRLDCWNLVNGNYPVLSFKGIAQLKEISKIPADWIITNTRFFNISFFGTLMAKKQNIRHLHIEHGTSHSKQGNIFVSLINIIYDHTFGWYVIKKSDIAAGVSDAARRFSDHIHNRDTLLIRNCIDAKMFKKPSIGQQAKVRRSLGIKDGRILTFVGRIIKAKGIGDLIESLSGTKGIRLLIIGDGNYLLQIKKLCKAKGIEERCIFLGQRNIDDIIKYLGITDIFVNPSYTEGLPTSVLEAGAMGVPIIATDVGGTREIITDKVDGYLIRPHDISGMHKKILELLDDAKLSKEFSSNIRKKVLREFDWKNERKKFLQLLREKN
jgi:glycosyltransferase involved in cell wall biosynthesis